jgi:hypothetical protein
VNQSDPWCGFVNKETIVHRRSNHTLSWRAHGPKFNPWLTKVEHAMAGDHPHTSNELFDDDELDDVDHVGGDNTTSIAIMVLNFRRHRRHTLNFEALWSHMPILWPRRPNLPNTQAHTQTHTDTHQETETQRHSRIHRHTNTNTETENTHTQTSQTHKHTCELTARRVAAPPMVNVRT